MAVWGRARFLSVTEAPRNTGSLLVSGVSYTASRTGYIVRCAAGKKHVVSLKHECQTGGVTRDFRLFQADSYKWHSLEVVDRVSETQLQVRERDKDTYEQVSVVALRVHKSLNQRLLIVGSPSPDAGPTLNQHWFCVSCLLSKSYRFHCE